MKKVTQLLVVIILLVFTSGCNEKENQNLKEETKMAKVVAIINDQEYEVTLEDNQTAREFYDLLPLELQMQELNGNEKYYYLDENLKTNSTSKDTINAGDIKLYGSNCLVLFYETFNTTYSYTDIGHISDTSFVNELPIDSVNIRFEIKE